MTIIFESNTHKIETSGSAPTPKPILGVSVTLSKYSCPVGTEVSYTVEFDQPITVPDIVPISITDRNGNHITNIGCTVTNGLSEGAFTMQSAGDFTVTNESINFHDTLIEARLMLKKQPWLRVYQ